MLYLDAMAENGITPNAYKVTRRNVTTGTFPTVGYVEITMVEDQFVAGADDLENMIAARVEEMVRIPEGNSDVGPDDPDSGGNTDDEGGWL